MFSKVALNFSYAWEVSNVTEMPNDISNVPNQFCKVEFIPYVLHQLTQFRDKVMKTRRFNSSITWDYRCFFLCFEYFLIMENLNILRRSKVSNHHIFIYMLIVSGTTQSYILKYCISFNRAYFDNRSQKSMYHKRLVKRKNTFKIDWFV